MVNVQSILDKLNNDSGELEKFHADPVGYFHQQGLTLPAAAQQQLVDHVKKNPGAKPAWSVGIVAAS